MNDPAVVAAEYATEERLLARQAIYQYATGPDPRDLVVAAVGEVRPQRVLEVGCGTGELAVRLRDELSVEVTATDLSPRMVDLARERDVQALVADVQALPFADGAFDCAVAAWMLYHVPDVDRAVAELARILRPGGRLVAATVHDDHLKELRDLVGAPPRRIVFHADNGADVLASHFGRVVRHDGGGEIRLPDRAAVEERIRASAVMLGATPEIPDFETPFVVRSRIAVFVADKA